jgi:hypothetical protein
MHGGPAPRRVTNFVCLEIDDESYDFDLSS